MKGELHELNKMTGMKRPEDEAANWHDVTEEDWLAWQQIFRASREILRLSSPCPVCGEKALH
jgi:hypothetical protein